MNEWRDGHEAFMRGFKDGYLEVDDTPVEKFNKYYELGFIEGWVERKKAEEVKTIKGE